MGPPRRSEDYVRRIVLDLAEKDRDAALQELAEADRERKEFRRKVRRLRRRFEVNRTLMKGFRPAAEMLLPRGMGLVDLSFVPTGRQDVRLAVARWQKGGEDLGVHSPRNGLYVWRSLPGIAADSLAPAAGWELIFEIEVRSRAEKVRIGPPDSTRVQDIYAEYAALSDTGDVTGDGTGNGGHDMNGGHGPTETVAIPDGAWRFQESGSADEFAGTEDPADFLPNVLTVTVGTIFEASHVPLHKWLLAFYLLSSSKKGISAHQIHRMLGVTYKTAWFMLHRIRYAMEQPPFQRQLTGVVEADETYVGGKVRRSSGPKV